MAATQHSGNSAPSKSFALFAALAANISNEVINSNGFDAAHENLATSAEQLEVCFKVQPVQEYELPPAGNYPSNVSESCCYRVKLIIHMLYKSRPAADVWTAFTAALDNTSAALHDRNRSSDLWMGSNKRCIILARTLLKGWDNIYRLWSDRLSDAAVWQQQPVGALFAGVVRLAATILKLPVPSRSSSRTRRRQRGSNSPQQLHSVAVASALYSAGWVLLLLHDFATSDLNFPASNQHVKVMQEFACGSHAELLLLLGIVYAAARLHDTPRNTGHADCTKHHESLFDSLGLASMGQVSMVFGHASTGSLCIATLVGIISKRKELQHQQDAHLQSAVASNTEQASSNCGDGSVQQQSCKSQQASSADAAAGTCPAAAAATEATSSAAKGSSHSTNSSPQQQHQFCLPLQHQAACIPLLLTLIELQMLQHKPFKIYECMRLITLVLECSSKEQCLELARTLIPQFMIHLGPHLMQMVTQQQQQQLVLLQAAAAKQDSSPTMEQMKEQQQLLLEDAVTEQQQQQRLQPGAAVASMIAATEQQQLQQAATTPADDHRLLSGMPNLFALVMTDMCCCGKRTSLCSACCCIMQHDSSLKV